MIKKIIFIVVGFWIGTLIFSHKTPKYAQHEVKAKVESLCQDTPILIDIAWAESEFTQWGEDGGVYLSKINTNGTHDMGVFQINTVHWGEAKRLGYDLKSLEGNIAYAKLLYERNGTRDWNSSSLRWRKRVAERYLAGNR